MVHSIITHFYKLCFNIMPRPSAESKESSTQWVQRFFLGGKCLWAEGEHSAPSNVEIEKERCSTYNSRYMPSWRGQEQNCLFFANKPFEFLYVSELYRQIQCNWIASSQTLKHHISASTSCSLFILIVIKYKLN
jgi:hypothetical protein